VDGKELLQELLRRYPDQRVSEDPAGAGMLSSLGAQQPEPMTGAGPQTGGRAPPAPSLRGVADNSSLEIFLNGGATVFSTRYYPAPGDVSVKLTGAACELCNL